MRRTVLAYVLLVVMFTAMFIMATPPAHSREVRSESAKVQFARTHACPATGAFKLPCKGYVIDHIRAIDCGGADDPSNMQWQTIAQAKAKDKWERSFAGCKHRTKTSPPTS